MVNIPGLLVLVVLYLAVLLVGILAARWFKRRNEDTCVNQDATEMSIVAGRKLGGLVGIFTMTATTVGGGYINGTAESIATQGLVWTLAPFGIFVGLLIGGLVFARVMRKREYITMFDAFQERYNNLVVTLLYLAAIAGDICWSASILGALGTSLSVILHVNVSVAIVSSAGVAILYTMFGHMIAVAYTDIVQLILIVFGLVLSVPFAVSNPVVENLGNTKEQWLGKLDTTFVGVWMDLLIAMTLGTIPWQAYFQRVLSVKYAAHAQLLSVVGAFGALILAVPSLIIGAVSVSTDWQMTNLSLSPAELNMTSLTLPLVLYHLTPNPVAILGLGAISAAVMSSLDSAVLASSSLFLHNIYRAILRKKAGDIELAWVQRVAVVIIGTISTILALVVPSVYGMFILAADIIFVIMLPQLVAVIFLSFSNTYGALSGYIVGLILRLGAGEPYLNLPAFIQFPWYNAEFGQLFPFRTFAMIFSFVTILITSKLSQWILNKFGKVQRSQEGEEIRESTKLPLNDNVLDSIRVKAECSQNDDKGFLDAHLLGNNTDESAL